MAVAFRKVLKTTLDELIKAERKMNMHRDAAICAGSWNKRGTKMEDKRLLGCFCELVYDLEWQSGIDSGLFMALVTEVVESEFWNETLYTILEQLGVEIVDEKWWFEGTTHKNPQTGKYSIVNGKEIYKLTSGETISVKFKGRYWMESAFSYNKRGKGELQGWEGCKLDGLSARVKLTDEVTE